MWLLSKCLVPMSASVFEIIFWIFTFFPPQLCCMGILLKRIQSRVQLGSASNRSSVEFLLFYSLAYGVFNITCFATSKSSNSNPNRPFSVVLQLFIIIIFVTGIFFPFAFYRSLLADTKFWRGLGKHNQGGIRFSEQITAGDVAKPTMELAVVGGDLQSMIATIGEHLVIDFAMLQIKSKIGDGATAEVYNGIYRDIHLAIKISTPPEVTPEVIAVFAAEANVTSSLYHNNIVRFYGICIRPPQIAMVVELCPKGNLKSSLMKNSLEWTEIRRCKACLDAARSLEYLHSKKLIHRDVKAANFFVAENWDVKLGDFGESTLQRSVDDVTKANRMEILGTVAFMAPELVAAKIHYTEAVDVYAFAILMWEVWTGGRDPFDDVTTFQIYELVGKGKRPNVAHFSTPTIVASAKPVYMIPDDRILEIMQLCWAQEVEDRITAAEAASRLTKVLYDLYMKEGYTEEARLLISEPSKLRKKNSIYGEDLFDDRGSISSGRFNARSSIASIKDMISNTFNNNGRSNPSRGSIFEFGSSLMDGRRGSIFGMPNENGAKNESNEVELSAMENSTQASTTDDNVVVSNPLQA